MKKIEAIIQQEKLEELKITMTDNFETIGLTVSQVLGFGNQKGLKEYIRGQEIITTLLPKVKISMIVLDNDVEAVIALILTICQTGEVGDGKIFVYNVEEAIRIRTGERGSAAIR
ncbi:nitrogen regulatory protein P-II 1 [Enterococcus sp. AZ170]|uniref:P-II family nitrogen regulator n=1 Tax=Enterococcus TaxID=1350 RepID=UPI001A92C7C0|nr:P-II family nitrogen regulator [Enterococcus ureilyticus]MBO0446639.1 P-II family nitrogen regulator [Enterococcus ureilyticus]